MKGANKAPLLAPYEQKVAAAADASDRQHAESDLNAMKMLLASIDATGAGSASRKIDLGGLTAVLEHHAGHTPTDVIVRVAERDIVYTGDLLFNHWYPVAIDASLTDWRKVLDRFAGYGRRTRFVAGHEVRSAASTWFGNRLPYWTTCGPTRKR